MCQTKGTQCKRKRRSKMMKFLCSLNKFSFERSAFSFYRKFWSMPMRSVTHMIFSQVEIFFVSFLCDRQTGRYTLAAFVDFILWSSFRFIYTSLLFSTHTVNLKSVHIVHPHFNRRYFVVCFCFTPSNSPFGLSNAPTISFYFSFAPVFLFFSCFWVSSLMCAKTGRHIFAMNI